LKEGKREGWKGQEEEEEDVSSYGMTLRKPEYTETIIRKPQFALCGELILKEGMDVS